MADFATQKGVLDTTLIPDDFSAAFCIGCGCHIGWQREPIDSYRVAYCNECMFDLTRETGEEE